MCKLYRVIYTCVHNKEIEISPCQLNQNPASCLDGIEIRNHHARWKCRTCRYYDYDRVRRGKAAIALPVPSPPSIPSPSSSEDIEIEHMEDTVTKSGVQIEHSENIGGVSTIAGGTDFGSDSERTEKRGGDRRRFKFKARAFLAASMAETFRERGAVTISSDKSDGLSPRRGAVVGGTGGSARERFGGFGGSKWRGDLKGMVSAVGGVSIEREARGRSSSTGSSFGNYRGADVEMDRGGLGLECGGAEMQREGSAFAGLGLSFGLGVVGSGEETPGSDSEGGGVGLGLGFGLGGFGMGRGGGGIPRIQIESVDGTSSTRRRSDSASSEDTVMGAPIDEGETDDGSQESVTAQFLDGADSSGPSQQRRELREGSSVLYTVSEVDPEDDGDDDFHDSQESVTSQILAHFLAASSGI